MSLKSVLLSILALITFIGVIFAIVFMFKAHFMLGLVGLALIFIPITLNRKAISEASGKIDEWFAKFIIPAIALIGVVFIVLTFTLWM